MLSKLKLNQFKDTSFVNLMTKRIFNVLLVANPYDAFMLEDDGRIDEKIFNEYMNLSLRYPPRFTQHRNRRLFAPRCCSLCKGLHRQAKARQTRKCYAPASRVIEISPCHCDHLRRFG